MLKPLDNITIENILVLQQYTCNYCNAYYDTRVNLQGGKALLRFGGIQHQAKKKKKKGAQTSLRQF